MGYVQYVGAQNPHSETINIAGYQNFILDATPGEILQLPDAVCSYLVSVEANWWVVANGWAPPPAGPQTGQIASVSSAYAIPTPPNQQVNANPTSAAFAVTLPDATKNAGQPVTIKNVGSLNSVQVAWQSGQTVDGSSGPIYLAPGQSITVLSDGSVNWRVTAQSVAGGIGAIASAVGPALPAWNTQWLIAKALAQAGLGVARVAVVGGGSYSAGQYGNSPANADALRYGFLGRLKTLLLQTMLLSADGFTYVGCLPGQLTSPSSPYGASTGGGNGSIPNSLPAASGGIGLTVAPSNTGSVWMNVYAPQDYDTGAYPAGVGPSSAFVDLFTLDYGGSAFTWSWNADSGAASGTVTCAASATLGQGILRRTSVGGLATGQAHNIALTNNHANGLVFVGHNTYYHSTGLQIFRNGISGMKAADYAVGPGATAGYQGGNSLSQDLIVPWAGLTSSSAPANNYVTSNLSGAFPFGGLDLAIIMLGGNDCTYGSSPIELEKSLTRFIHACRRGNPSTGPTNPGCSILIIAEPYVSEYSDNYSAVGAEQNTEWQRYKSVLRLLAERYRCGFLDTEVLFGETPVANGWMTAGQVHPNQNPAIAATATPVNDGHLLLAQAVYGMI